MALCGMKCVNLNKTVKILGDHFSYNKNLEEDRNFCEHIVKIESKIMKHETVNFVRKGYGLQVFPKLCIFY